MVLIHEFQTEQRRVYAERVNRNLKTGHLIGRRTVYLLWPVLILERGLNVGVNQILNARREAVAR